MLYKKYYSKETDIFDWMNTFSFSAIIDILYNNFNIFDELKQDFNNEKENEIVFSNFIYNIRMPHDAEYLSDKNIIINKYMRRYNRFIDMKKINENFLFIRFINYESNSYYKNDIFEYTEENYNKFQQFLPENNIIILITHKQIPSNIKDKIYNKFIVLDDIIMPDFIAYGPYMDHKEKIINLYNIFFNFCDKNYNNLHDINNLILLKEKINKNNLDNFSTELL